MNLVAGLALLAAFAAVIAMFAASRYAPKARNKKLARVVVLVPLLVAFAPILVVLALIFVASARGR